jgi:hypothetical protein
VARVVLVSLAFAGLIGCDGREMASTTTQAATTDCPPVTWTLDGGDPNVLAAGDVVTNPRDLVLENGIVRVTYEAMWNNPETPAQDEPGAHMLYRRDGDEYRRAFSQTYGDWTFFSVPFLEGASQATVLSASEEAVEIAFEWPHHRLDTAGPYNGCYQPYCGILERNHQGEAIYRNDGSGEYLLIHEVRFVKTIRLERCSEGYYVGYHSDPPLMPKNGLEGNNETSYGEREIGTGWGNRVTFSSAGVVVRNPEAGHHMWMGIDDPNYYPTYLPEYVAGQPPGFPNEQLEGPWWVADLPGYPDIPFARFIALEHRLEVGVWQFDPQHAGATVVHFMNEEIEADGRAGRYQVFLGAFPYVSADFAAEPTPEVYDGVIQRLPLTWPN